MDKNLPGIIVTGASGFIGSHFLEAVMGDFRLFCLARRSQKEAGVPVNPNIRWTQVDIAKWDPLREVVSCIKKNGGADYVIHLAGYYDFSNTPNPEYERTNVNGTRNILKLAKLVGIKRFIFASSLAACKFPPIGQAITEDSPPDADFPYAWSKREGEKMITESAEWFPSAIIRLAAVYSDWCEYPPVYMFLKTWLSQIWNSRILGGKGESAVTYIHINDLISFFLRVIQKSEDLPRLCILNASPSHTTSHMDLYKSATHYFYGQEIKPIKMPKIVAIQGMAVRQFIGKLIGKPPFERLWMARYIDKKLNIDANATYRQLNWKPTPRYDIKRRLLFLIENMKNHSTVWDLRNEVALKRIARRPNMAIYNALFEARENLINEIYTYIRKEEFNERFRHYHKMSESVLKWYIALILQLITTVVRTNDRTLMRNYAQIIGYRRFIENFDLNEVRDAMQSIGDIIRQYLQKLPEMNEFKQNIYDSIILTIQLVVDEIEDSFEHLASQPPELLEKFSKISLPTESVDLERIVHQLEDICQDVLQDRLSWEIQDFRKATIK